MKRGRRWRIGELAAATGLTVRTLHHYEHIGLLGPAARTEGRQRLYDARDVQRLYRIRALRGLGLSLSDIGRMLEDKGAGLGDVLRAHLARVDAELQRLGRLRAILDRACAQADRTVEPDDVIALIQAMSQVSRRIDARTRTAAPRRRRVPLASARPRAAGLHGGGDAPSAPRARAVARTCSARMREFAGGDRATLDALALLRRVIPPRTSPGGTPACSGTSIRPLPAFTKRSPSHAERTDRDQHRSCTPRHRLRVLGNPAHPTVMLVMGIAAQLVHWPRGFLQALVQRGLHVVRFDNRDSGRSTHLRNAPPANLPAALQGDLSSVSYTLSDMAADAAGLLDTLKVEAAHVVGASMGGRDRADPRDRAPEAGALAHIDDVDDRRQGCRASPSANDEVGVRRAPGPHARGGRRARRAERRNRRLACIPGRPGRCGRAGRACVRPRLRRGRDRAPGCRDGRIRRPHPAAARARRAGARAARARRHDVRSQRRARHGRPPFPVPSSCSSRGWDTTSLRASGSESPATSPRVVQRGQHHRGV